MSTSSEFKTESDLVRAFSKNANKVLRMLNANKKQHGFIIHEFNSLFGVADLVFGTTNKAVKQQVKRPPLNINWMFPLAELEVDESFSFNEFEKRFALAKGAAKKRLQDYEAAGFLRQQEDGNYFVASKYAPVADLIVSVEAKLKDWRRALLQATRYKRYSDYTFVLLDKKYSRPALDNLEHFYKSNVGLILMERNKIELIYKPELNKKKMAEYSLRLNEVILSHLRDRL